MSNPTGMAASIAERNRPRSSGRSSAVREVRTALMPQPMSTPTAAGASACRIAITEPTVAPLPKCTSGITATPSTHGRLPMLRSCCSACGSISDGSVHTFTGARVPGSVVYGMPPPSARLWPAY